MYGNIFDLVDKSIEHLNWADDNRIQRAYTFTHFLDVLAFSFGECNNYFTIVYNLLQERCVQSSCLILG